MLSQSPIGTLQILYQVEVQLVMDINMLSCDYIHTPDIAEEDTSFVRRGTNRLTTIEDILMSI